MAIPPLDIETSKVPATENAAVNVSTTAETSLGSKSITVDIPEGATVTSVIAVAQISIMNDSATAQKIGLRLNVEGVNLFTQSNIIGLGAIEGASASYMIAEDASDEVTVDDQVVDFEAFVTLSVSGSVRFHANYILILTYST